MASGPRGAALAPVRLVGRERAHGDELHGEGSRGLSHCLEIACPSLVTLGCCCPR